MGLVVCLIPSIVTIGDHRVSRVLSSFSFSGPFTKSIQGWETKGSTVINPEMIRLTPDDKDKRGSLVNARPYFFKSIELTLNFRIHGHRIFGGDGLALWLTDQPIKQGSFFGGPEDAFFGVALVADTYYNDGDSNRFAIYHSDGVKPRELVGSCEARFHNVESSFIHLYIEDGGMNVFVDSKGNGNWIRCSDPLKLMLPSRFFFGITAQTGSEISGMC